MKSPKNLHNHGINYFISDTDFLKILDVKWLWKRNLLSGFATFCQMPKNSLFSRKFSRIFLIWDLIRRNPRGKSVQKKCKAISFVKMCDEKANIWYLPAPIFLDVCDICYLRAHWGRRLDFDNSAHFVTNSPGILMLATKISTYLIFKYYY